jgi:hypothetical protein
VQSIAPAAGNFPPREDAIDPAVTPMKGVGRRTKTAARMPTRTNVAM